jgi:hypothetical protein
MQFLDSQLEKLKLKLKWTMKPEIVVQRIKEVRNYCVEIQAILDKFKRNYNIIKQKCFQIANEVSFVKLSKGHAISLEEFDRLQKA